MLGHVAGHVAAAADVAAMQAHPVLDGVGAVDARLARVDGCAERRNERNVNWAYDRARTYPVLLLHILSYIGFGHCDQHTTKSFVCVSARFCSLISKLRN